MDCALLPLERIDLDMPACVAALAIERLAGLLEGDSSVLSVEGLRTEALVREGISPTTLGDGVAVPHARTSHVNRIVMAAGRSRDGVDFGNNVPPVHLVFLIATPKDRIAEYLTLVGDLARTLRDARVREALMDAESPESFLAALS